MCSAVHFKVLYICEKFRENIMNVTKSYGVTQVHGSNGYVQRVRTPKLGKPVTVHVFCILSHGASHWCEIS